MSDNARVRADHRLIVIVALAANLVLTAGLAVVLAGDWQGIRHGVEQVARTQAAFWADSMNQRYDLLQSTCRAARNGPGGIASDLRDPGTAEVRLDGFRRAMPFVTSIALVSPAGTVLAAAPPSSGLRVAGLVGPDSAPARSDVPSESLRIGLPQATPGDPARVLTTASCTLGSAASGQRPRLVYSLALQSLLDALQHALPARDVGRDWVPAVGLLRSDGRLLARLPLPGAPAGSTASTPASRGIIARELAAHPGSNDGVFLGVGAHANDTRLIGAWRRLSDHPVVAFVSYPAAMVASLWWRQAWPLLLGWSLILLLQAVAGILVVRAVIRQWRLAQINGVLAQANKAVADADDESGLLQAICRIAIGSGGMELAWIGIPDAAGGFTAVAAAPESRSMGAARDLFESAWRQDRAVFASPERTAWLAAPLRLWRNRADPHSAAALPIHRGGRPHAIFGVHCRGGADFSAEERDQLEDLARSIEQGLDRLDLVAAEHSERESRQRQEELVRSMLAQIDILISARSDTEVLDSACTRLLETGLFAAVWIGRPDAQGQVHVLNAGGNGAEVLAAQPALAVGSADSHAVARAWNDGGPAQDGSPDSPLLTPWSAYALPGWTPLALAVPLQRGGGRWAVLVLVLLNSADLDDALHPLLVRVGGLIERALAEIDLKALLESEQAQQRYLARHDALTGLPNRLSLEHHLPLAMARARRNDTLLAVGVMDLDDFKPVNDRFGHAAGDGLLRELGRRLRSALRETDLVARLGGDEFVLVFEDLGQPVDLHAVLDRVHSAVETPFELDHGESVDVGMSLGLTLYPTDDAQPEVLLRHADAALYAAKSHKAERSTWWQVWGDAVASPAAPVADAPPPVDAYGDAAAEVLGLADQLLASHADKFIDRFFAGLANDADSATLLAALSPEERQQLRLLQRDHLRRILSPSLRRDAHEELARRIGRIHALTGVTTGAVVGGIGAFLQSIHDVVADAPLRRRDRAVLAQIATARLQGELQWQTDEAQQAREEFQRTLYLLERTQSDVSQWADLARSALQSIVGLPGLAAAVIYKPDAQGRFVPEFTAGAFDDYLAAIDRDGIGALQLDPQSRFGQTPHPRCWRSEQIETNISYVSDPRMTLWRGAALRAGIRSSAAIPIKDNRGRMLAVLGLYGRYPAMFETAPMRGFMVAIEQWFERASYGLMVRRDQALLPARDRRAWRDRLFSGGLELHYQPIVDLRTGTPTVVEALARLRLEDGTLIHPGQFLPSFGASELTRLFTLGLDQALTQLHQWDAAGLTLGLSLNLPPEVLLRPDCARLVGDALAQHRIAPERLRLELLEDADFQTDAQRDAAVRALAATHVRLVMDDLGSGYSTLLRLRTLPFHTVKIDQGLVRGIPEDTAVEAQGMIGFIGALIRMTQALGLHVVVEGLETPALVEMAAILGADSGQGYALAHPMPAAALVEWTHRFALARIPPRGPATALGREALRWIVDSAERGVSWIDVPRPLSEQLH